MSSSESTHADISGESELGESRNTKKRGRARGVVRGGVREHHVKHKTDDMLDAGLVRGGSEGFMDRLIE